MDKPSVLPRLEGWFGTHNKDFLSCFVGRGDVVIEIGAWLGMSTLWLAEKVGPLGKIVSIDHFEGSRDHKIDPRHASILPILWETFVVNCWEMRDRIVPVCGSSRDALPYLQASGFEPNVIYVDGSHDYDDVVLDLTLSLALWPKARVVGDDFEVDSVLRAAFNVAQCFGKNVVGNKRCFTFTSYQ